MSNFQGYLDNLFQGQSFGPRDGFSPLAWQAAIRDVYKDSIVNFLESSHGNGHAGQHVFPFFAATATGKTKASGLLSSFLFNHGLINQMFFACPNESILFKTKDDYLKNFGIHLEQFRIGRDGHGVPRHFHGLLITYQHLFKLWDNEKRRKYLPGIFGGRSLVIFDEVHHLIEDESWGLAALHAFMGASFVVSMTGTPFNSKRGRFAYCNYVETEDTARSGLYRLKADFNFSLGTAAAEGIVRKPHFIFSGRMEDGPEATRIEIRIPPNLDETRTVTFDDKLDDALSKLRLRGAVVAGSVSRKTFLRNALALCEEEGRRVVIFLGGDTKGSRTATLDANVLLPAELREFGYTDDDFETIVGVGKDGEKLDNKEILRRINAFGKSDKKILICINMISEGVDIPELSAAIFLTVVTAKQTTIQRIGRALRLMDPHMTALIFMFADPTNVAIAREIEAEIKAEESRLGRKARVERSPAEEGKYRRAEAVGISGGNLSSAIFDGQENRMADYKAVEAFLKAKNLPHTMAHLALELLGVTDASR